MTDRPDPVTVPALADCASEPIRIPGAIQPHGYLFALDVRTLALRHASANLAALLDRNIDALLGHPPEDWLEPAQLESLTRTLHEAGSTNGPQESILTVRGHVFSSIAYRVDGLLVVELETHSPAAPNAEPLLARTLGRLQEAVGLQEFHQITVHEVRELTGCDRVVIYAFDTDGHGRVLAEAKATDVDSYLGLYFPATDIPAQARALYELNWSRLIPDVDYVPVPIVGLQTGASGAPLDLTLSKLRSVSPVHREYMRNMGMQSSMSVSLMRGGRLWGLLSCVHRTPRLLSRQVQAAALSLGRLLSLQISALEGLRESQLIDANRPLLVPLIAKMEGSPNSGFARLKDIPESLLRLTDATGAAIVTGLGVELVGVCPSPAQVLQLSEWVAQQAVATGHFVTRRLSADYEDADVFSKAASGLLAVSLPRTESCILLWFRAEMVRTVSWAGNPEKTPSFDSRTAALRLSPRNSFDEWKTLLSGQSAKWEPHQVQAALDLRRKAIELDLAHQVAREQKAVASRDELVAVVSHELRSPLQVVALQASLLIRTLSTDTSIPSRRMLLAAQSIQRASRRMGEMLGDLLDLSAIEQGRYSVKLSSRTVKEIFEDAAALLSPLAETKRIALSFSTEPGLTVIADAERLYQVISNLVSNALKFTAEDGMVDIFARPVTDSEGALVEFVVSDTGRGMTAEEMGHIFERFWRVREANPTGLGLGLYIARGIVQAHGGTLRVESVVGVGSTFYFTIPAAVLPVATESPITQGRR